MKKITKTMVASLIAVIMAFSLMACGKPSGKYVIEEFSVKVSGGINVTIKPDELEDSDDLDFVTKMMLEALKSMTFEFSGDEVKISMEDEETETYKYKMDGKKIVIEDDEEEAAPGTMTFENGKIYMQVDEDGMAIKVVFKKA